MFKFNGSQVRVVTQNCEPWFVAKDVADILGYVKTEAMTRRLDDDEKDTTICSTLGGEQSLIIINEFGLYNAILGSTKKESKEFKRWVTHEVLPAIRKTGTYGNHQTLMATVYNEMELRIKAELERDEYRKNLEKLAFASKLTFGEISHNTGLPKDIVIAPYCKSSKRTHTPQSQRFIQLILPLSEIIDDYRRQIGIDI